MWAVFRSLVTHVTGFSNALHAVARGDFSVRLDPDENRLVRPLYEDFNAMASDLEHVQTLKESFAADFSHEFKTPVSAINGFAKLLLEEDLPEENRTRYLQVIAQESERLAHLASNTLLLGRLDAQTSLPSAPFALDEQIRQAVLVLESAWSAKDLELDVDLPRTVVRGNAEMLKEVWINLVGNAVKFTPPGGAVRVSLAAGERAGTVRVEVADSGPGMSAQERAHAFDRYWQADPSRATSGNGLGLAIVARIVRLSGGRVWAEGEPGAGCTFVVELPREG